jgi:hypothetical protein
MPLLHMPHAITASRLARIHPMSYNVTRRVCRVAQACGARLRGAPLPCTRNVTCNANHCHAQPPRRFHGRNALAQAARMHTVMRLAKTRRVRSGARRQRQRRHQRSPTQCRQADQHAAPQRRNARPEARKLRQICHISDGNRNRRLSPAATLTQEYACAPWLCVALVSSRCSANHCM